MIRKIFIVICALILITTLQYYAFVKAPPIEVELTNQQINQIYENLLKYTGLSRSMLPKLIIIKNDAIINAYQDSSNNVIAIYSGMIKFSANKDEISAVLAHEIAHFMLDHSALNPTMNSDYQTILEGNADKFGVYLMMRAGYDTCKARDLWIKLRNSNGDYEYNSDHPNYSYRIWQFEFPMCGG